MIFSKNTNGNQHQRSVSPTNVVGKIGYPQAKEKKKEEIGLLPHAQVFMDQRPKYEIKF